MRCNNVAKNGDYCPMHKRMYDTRNSLYASITGKDVASLEEKPIAYCARTPKN